MPPISSMKLLPPRAQPQPSDDSSAAPKSADGPPTGGAFDRALEKAKHRTAALPEKPATKPTPAKAIAGKFPKATKLSPAKNALPSDAEPPAVDAATDGPPPPTDETAPEMDTTPGHPAAPPIASAKTAPPVDDPQDVPADPHPAAAAAPVEPASAPARPTKKVQSGLHADRAIVVAATPPAVPASPKPATTPAAAHDDVTTPASPTKTPSPPPASTLDPALEQPAAPTPIVTHGTAKVAAKKPAVTAAAAADADAVDDSAAATATVPPPDPSPTTPTPAPKAAPGFGTAKVRASAAADPSRPADSTAQANAAVVAAPLPADDPSADATDDPTAAVAPATTRPEPTPTAVPTGLHPAAPTTYTAKAVAPTPAPPEAAFVDANHPKIVTGVTGQLLPSGGTLQIRLDPPDLGPLQLTVRVRDGAMTAEFQSSNAETTRLLSHSLGELKTALEAAGVTVDKIHVQQTPKDESASDHPGTGGNGSPHQTPHEQQQQARQEQQRRDMMQRMWAKLSGTGDPLDLVA